jgi:hypothetical protein
MYGWVGGRRTTAVDVAVHCWIVLVFSKKIATVSMPTETSQAADGDGYNCFVQVGQYDITRFVFVFQIINSSARPLLVYK